MAKFKKCPRCDLNYILEDESICDICKNELNGINFGEIEEIDEDTLEEICPVCKVNFLEENETICPSCLEKQEIEECRKEYAIALEDDDRWDDVEEIEEEEVDDISLDMDLSLETLKEEEEDWDTDDPLEDEEDE